MKIERTETEDLDILKDERNLYATALEILVITEIVSKESIENALRFAQKIL